MHWQLQNKKLYIILIYFNHDFSQVYIKCKLVQNTCYLYDNFINLELDFYTGQGIYFIRKINNDSFQNHTMSCNSN